LRLQDPNCRRRCPSATRVHPVEKPAGRSRSSARCARALLPSQRLQNAGTSSPSRSRGIRKSRCRASARRCTTTFSCFRRALKVPPRAGLHTGFGFAACTQCAHIAALGAMTDPHDLVSFASAPGRSLLVVASPEASDFIRGTRLHHCCRPHTHWLLAHAHGAAPPVRHDSI
jgi:hypothetical protein